MIPATATDSSLWYPSRLYTSGTDGVDPWVILLRKLAVLPAGVHTAWRNASAWVCRAELAISVVALDHLVRQVVGVSADFVGILNSSPVTHREHDGGGKIA